MNSPDLGRGKAVAISAAFLLSGLALAAGLYGLLAPRLLPESPGPAHLALLQAGVMLVGFGGVTWVFAARVVHLDVTALRWRPAGLGGFGRGFLIGAAPAALTMLLGVVAGGRWLSDGAPVTAWFGTAARLGLALFPSALAEELVFRGLPLVVLALAFGRGTGIVAMAVLFGLTHALNPEATTLALGNVALAGVLLGLAFYLPGGLWTATGAHLGWNLTLAALAAPVSGVPFPVAGLDYRPGATEGLTGGAFGPEGGLLATATLAVAAVLLARRVRKEFDA